MKFCPGVVPQCPTTSGLTSESASGRCQQRVVVEIDLTDRQVVRRSPVSVHPYVAVRVPTCGCLASLRCSSWGVVVLDPVDCVVDGVRRWSVDRRPSPSAAG